VVDQQVRRFATPRVKPSVITKYSVCLRSEQKEDVGSTPEGFFQQEDLSTLSDHGESPAEQQPELESLLEEYKTCFVEHSPLDTIDDVYNPIPTKVGHIGCHGKSKITCGEKSPNYLTPD
jgi:hypothetical protein